jgi:hypothetical protein
VSTSAAGLRAIRALRVRARCAIAHQRRLVSNPRSRRVPCRDRWAIGAAGSALPSHGRGRRFEPGIAHERPHSTGGVLHFPHSRPLSPRVSRCGIRDRRLPRRRATRDARGNDDRRSVVHRIRGDGCRDRPFVLREALRVVVRTRPRRRRLCDRRRRRANRRPRRRRGHRAVRVLPRRRPRGGGRHGRTPRRHRPVDPRRRGRGIGRDLRGVQAVSRRPGLSVRGCIARRIAESGQRQP